MKRLAQDAGSSKEPNQETTTKRKIAEDPMAHEGLSTHTSSANEREELADKNSKKRRTLAQDGHDKEADFVHSQWPEDDEAL
jgi:hypothetical protein